MNPLRRAWQAASAPEAFHRALPEEVRLSSAALAGGSGLVSFLVVASLLAAWATRSDPLPFLIWLPALLLPYLAIGSAFGALLAMRPAGIDLRAFEIAAWGWLPAGFAAVAVLPAGLFAPGPALIVAAALLPAWHLWSVFAGFSVHAVARPNVATMVYGATVFGLPLLVAGIALVAFGGAG